MIGLIVAVVAGVAWWAWKGDDDNSAREDFMSDDDGNQVADELGDVADAIGWPYWYGKGDPSTPWQNGPAGVDCSGFVQMALVRIGALSPDAPDRSAAALANVCDPVELGDERPGDLACYPGHVMLVCGYPDTDGHAAVMGASGGRSTTKGDDPKAYVKTFGGGNYRSDFVCYMRLRPGETGVL